MEIDLFAVSIEEFMSWVLEDDACDDELIATEELDVLLKDIEAL